MSIFALTAIILLLKGAVNKHFCRKSFRIYFIFVISYGQQKAKIETAVSGLYLQIFDEVRVLEIRTDLAIENTEVQKGGMEGLSVEEYSLADIRVTCVEVQTPQAAELVRKPIGRYVTAEGMNLTEDFRNVREQIEGLAKEIRKMLPQEGAVLVAGLGNRAITADALGAKSIGHILATRHIQGNLAESTGLKGLRSVAAVAAGVLGETGLEAAEMLWGLTEVIRPAAVIAVDALTARSMERLGNTVQLGNTGIVPGSGVGNHRYPLNEETLGVPVIAVGVPTVVDAATLVYDLSGGRFPEEAAGKSSDSLHMTVTPRNIDAVTDRAAKLVGMAINCALQPEYDFDTLAALVS